MLAKGKRGIVHIGKFKGKQCAVKEANPSSEALRAVEFEYEMLLRVNKLGIGPKVFGFKEGKLYMELIKGSLIGDFIQEASRINILNMVKEVLNQLHKLDKAGLNKSELTNPYKHIIITKEKVVQIDFERCRPSKKPQNITQFMNYLLRPHINKILVKKEIYVNPDKIHKLSQKYSRAQPKFKKNLFPTQDNGKNPRFEITGQEKFFKEIQDEVLQKSFTTKIYRACAAIPKGKVSTYKELAKAVGSKAYRAVGQVMHNNPFAPDVPCHRVIASDRTLGGFATGINKKRRMLENEGVIIKNNKVQDICLTNSSRGT